MRWDDFASDAPALAALGHERFDSSELVMLGTLRRDGSPRVTPLEYFFYDGELTLGGMWQSMKLLDLLRDPRCVMHSTTHERSGEQGDFKLYGRALALDEPSYRERYAEAVREAIGWAPSEPYHLFRLDITSAAFVQFGESTEAVAERLRADARTEVRMIGADANTSGYVVATWQPPES
jgi:hypothetical protein